jgi:hypothetical protein
MQSVLSKSILSKSLLSLSLLLLLSACGGGSSDKGSSGGNGGAGQGGNQTGISTGNQTGNVTNGNGTEVGNGTGIGNGTNVGNQTGIDNQTETGNNTNSTNGTGITGSNVMSDFDYVLPPMPDPKENDKTLLGIDINKNGVRDDVEIWIYENYQTYKECKEHVTEHSDKQGNYTSSVIYCEGDEKPFHPIVREIAMQQARAYQIVIQDPDRALELSDYVRGGVACESYFALFADGYNENLLLNRDWGHNIDVRDIQFNTKERLKAYLKYDSNLGGHVFSSPENRRSKCDFNIDKLLKDYPVENYISGN